MGMQDKYQKEIFNKGYFAAHNSFLEFIIYFGFFFFCIYLYLFIKEISKIESQKIDFFCIMSFGMILHGVLNFFMIPLLFAILKVSEESLCELK
jgi:hypothetical protein